MSPWNVILTILLEFPSNTRTKLSFQCWSCFGFHLPDVIILSNYSSGIWDMNLSDISLKINLPYMLLRHDPQGAYIHFWKGKKTFPAKKLNDYGVCACVQKWPDVSYISKRWVGLASHVTIISLWYISLYKWMVNKIYILIMLWDDLETYSF